VCDRGSGALVWRRQEREGGQNADRLLRLLAWVPSLPFSGEATRRFGEIRADLARKGTPIGPYDLQIAAIASVNDLILVTNNTSEFGRVPNLQVEDWTV
jgi:tRNA(fMet)-specific endonuclease VapC